MIFQRERLMDVAPEAQPLLEMHYQEIAWRQDKIPLDVDWGRYKLLDESNLALCFTGRVSGKLMAYSVFFLSTHPHYNSTKYAKNDIIFVHPDYRGISGMRLIKYCEAELVNLGVQVITYHVKECLDWGGLAVHLGHDKVETCYSKWVGG